MMNLPEAKDIGGKVNAAMRDIEENNLQLVGVLPKTYNLFTSTLPRATECASSSPRIATRKRRR
jgi:hypothetical protein